MFGMTGLPRDHQPSWKINLGEIYLSESAKKDHSLALEEAQQWMELYVTEREINGEQKKEQNQELDDLYAIIKKLRDKNEALEKKVEKLEEDNRRLHYTSTQAKLEEAIVSIKLMEEDRDDWKKIATDHQDELNQLRPNGQSLSEELPIPPSNNQGLVVEITPTLCDEYEMDRTRGKIILKKLPPTPIASHSIPPAKIDYQEGRPHFCSPIPKNHKK